jgi:hypothetical protein
MSPKSESKFWGYIRNGMRGKWDVTRLECTLPGIPDVCYGMNGITGFIELKEMTEFPKRVTTPVRIKNLTPEQKLWMHTRRKNANFVFLFVAVDKEFFLFDAEDIYNIETWTSAEWRSLAVGYWEKSINWTEFERLLYK